MSSAREQTSCPSSPLMHPHEFQQGDGERTLYIQQGSYHLRSAASETDRLAAFRLRFLVFNLELGEGLEAAYATGHDVDPFDAVCDHLVVEHSSSGAVVGTYRLQTETMAAANLGFYSQREFDFAPYRQLQHSVIEPGRACVHRDHRSTEVLNLLWRGIAEYALHHGGHYLIGCSSLTSQDPMHGSAVYEALQKYLVEPQLRTVPRVDSAMPLVPPGNASDKIPKLLRAYLAVGAKICGLPAIDREFKTIDFLTTDGSEVFACESSDSVSARLTASHKSIGP